MCARMCTYQLRGKNNIIIIITILRTFLSIHYSFKVYTYRLQFYKKRLLKFVKILKILCSQYSIETINVILKVTNVNVHKPLIEKRIYVKFKIA